MRWPRAVGVFLEFRTIPVLLWSYTAVTLGTAVAFAETGVLDGVWFLATMVLATTVQGFVTHAVNEIYDWRSGTDRDPAPRALSGGSKVRNANLLTERDLWSVFAVSTAVVVVIAAATAALRSPWTLVFVVPGYLSGVAYTAPPSRTAYRPWLGEWSGGFLGVMLSGVGAYFIQTLTVSPLAVVAAATHACTCVGMLLVHHYLDAPADARANPPKRTTVVHLGFPRARDYASAFAVAALGLAAVASLFAWPFLVALAPLAVVLALHRRVDPTDVASVTAKEIGIIQGGIVAGMAVAVVLAPVLLLVALLAVPAYVAHYWVATSPAVAARAVAAKG